MLSSIFASITMGFTISLNLSLFATPIIVFLRTIFIIPFKQKKMVQKALDKGHYVDAKLVKTYDDWYEKDDGSFHVTNSEIGIYEYKVNNKTITYRGNCVKTPPDTVRLFYIKNPKKATDANSFGVREIPWLKIFLKTFLIIGIVCSILVFIKYVL